MISNYSRWMLYLCPDCSKPTVKKITAFDFSNNSVKQMLCSDDLCLTPAVFLKSVKDKYRIKIQCAICNEEHIFNISKNTIWGKDFFMLKCPQSGVSILFVSDDEERVKLEFEAQNDRLFEYFSEDDEEQDVLDLLFDAIERINELAKDKLITCSCSSKNISVSINLNSITLTCNDCRRTVVMDVDEALIEELITSDGILLE